MRTISTADVVKVIKEVLSIDVDQRASEAGVEIDSLALRTLSFDSLAILQLGIILEEAYAISINPAFFPLTATATVGELRDFINATAS